MQTTLSGGSAEAFLLTQNSRGPASKNESSSQESMADHGGPTSVTGQAPLQPNVDSTLVQPPEQQSIQTEMVIVTLCCFINYLLSVVIGKHTSCREWIGKNTSNSYR